MRIAFHIGAHCTDNGALLRNLLQNNERLAKEGISVPGPGRYRQLITTAAQKLRGERTSKDAQDTLLEEILDDDTAERVILSFENFICVPGRVFDNATFYEKADYKLAWLRNLFADHEVEFFIALRNPATFTPALMRHPDQTHKSYDALLQGIDPADLCWSDVISGIRQSTPDAPLTAWCNEDTPLIWPEIIREVTGHDPNTEMRGGLAVAARIMKREGVKRMKSYLSSHPPATEIQRRRIVAAFLEKYVLEEEIDQEIDVPGWTDLLVEEISERYEEDVLEIARMDGVTLLSP